MKIDNRKVIYLFYVLFSLVIVFNACKHAPAELAPGTPISEKDLIILKWNQAYPTETPQMAETGFLWALSFLGAELNKGDFKKAVLWKGNKLFVNIRKLGFSEPAILALKKLILELKQSEEYKIMEAIDLGRFVMLTLNSSNHYYKITGIPNSFLEFKKNKMFDPKQFVATNSSISLHDRIIDLPDSNITDFSKSAYVSNECEGKIKDGKGRITSYEVKEQMPNGQFRFAIYDTTGSLLVAANGLAGKPSKCLWCHETNIQPLFTTQIDEPNYYGADMFNRIVTRNTQILYNYRQGLNSDIDFEKKQDHTYTELLYITFMEPSQERLALEWGISIAEVKSKLMGIPTHTHSEFSYLGQLYYRTDIEIFSPYYAIKPPNSAREKSLYEPNLIR